MSLRLIEIVLLKKNSDKVHKILKEEQCIEYMQIPLKEDKVLDRILLESEDTESVLNLIEKKLKEDQYNRLMITSVEATLPRHEPDPEPISYQKKSATDKKKTERINREELYEKMKEFADCTKVYMMMTALSAVVSAIGLQQNNSTVIIGAMVIAPLFGPNMALALGTCLGDLLLIKRSLFTNFIGILIAIAVSFSIGLLIHVDPSTTAIQSRISISLGDLLLAIVSGIAGSIAITTTVSSALIGVMVAVALLPALVNFGLLLGNGLFELAVGAFSLFLMNLICINIAGVASFLIQGIYPATWWDKKRALKATRIAIAIWLTLLLILLCLFLLFHKEFI